MPSRPFGDEVVGPSIIHALGYVRNDPGIQGLQTRPSPLTITNDMGSHGREDVRVATYLTIGAYNPLSPGLR